MARKKPNAKKSAPTPPKKAVAKRKSAKPAAAPLTLPLGPRDGEVLLTEMARRLEMTVQSCGAWCKRPGAPVRVEGKHVYVRAAEFLRWREKQLVQEAVRRAMPSVSLDQARTRKEIAHAEMAELTVAEKRGEVVTIEDYVDAIDRVLVRIAARLRAIPIRLAHLGDDVELAAELEVERVITEMNRFDEDVLEDPDEDEDETNRVDGDDRDDDED